MKPRIQNARGGLLAVVCLAASPASAQAPLAAQPGASHQLAGPAVIELRGKSAFNLPPGFVFLDETATRILLDRLGTPPAGGEAGVVIPPKQDWFAVIKFLDTGFVNDRAWRTLDREAILNRLREIDRGANARRQVAGAAAVTSLDWEQPPAYDPVAHRLEWAVNARTSTGAMVNRASALLGRDSTVEIFLVDQTQEPSNLAIFQRLASSFRFYPGQRYEDHIQGETTARAGLEALLVGPLAAPPKVEAPEVRRTIPGWARIYLAMGGLAVSAAIWAAIRRLLRYRRERLDARLPVFDADRYYQNLTKDLYRGES